jgi:uncharacterized protein (UPF0210 family)
MNAKQITLSNTTLSAVSAAVRADGSADNQWAKLRDLLIADGVQASMLETEANGGNVELVNQVKAAVVAGFTKSEQAVLIKETKTLDDSDKLFKRVTQQKIGSKLARVRKLISEKEEKAEKLVLIYNSHYAKIDSAELFDFIQELDLEELKAEIDIPEINSKTY